MNRHVPVPPPPRIDLREDSYALVRSVLSGAGYSEVEVLSRLGVEALPDVFEGGFYQSIEESAGSALDVLVQLFLLGRGVPLAVIESWLGAEFLAACVAQGIVRAPESAAKVFATVTIHPSPGDCSGVWFASDRVAPAPDAGLPSSPELIYPTVTPSAQTFLRLLPQRECGRFLEVCAGCGPAAVLAGEFAGEVVASDIDPRAVAFCAYNGRLNGIDEFTAIAGSFYENAEGEFDLIAAHPPYMPTDGPVETFYGGGIDGTDLVRELVSALPGKLAPGGMFYAVALIPESGDLSVEGRLRRWLGDAAKHFDVFFFPLHTRSLIEVAYEASAKLARGMDAASHYRRRLLAMGHREFLYGAFLLRRHGGTEVAIDIRRKLAARSSWRELLWCVDWETAWKDHGRRDVLLDERLRARTELEVVIAHHPSPQGLEPVRFQAIARYPFEMESQIQGWMAVMLGLAGVPLTGRELMEAAKREGIIHPETPVPEFARLLGTFVSGGFLETAICPLPEAAE